MIQDSTQSQAKEKGNSVAYTIAIVGGGFSGTILAVNLLHKTFAQPVNIILLEKANQFARGVAYSTKCPLHLLNVPAGAMSALVDEPQNFLNWAINKDTSVGPLTFVKRLEYGNYLQQLLDDAAARKNNNINFTKINDEVIELTLANNNAAAVLNTASGRSFAADKVVLALGNFAPVNPHVAATTFYDSRLYFQNPWSTQDSNVYSQSDPLLLIGTGLTMVDKSLQLNSEGHKGVIHALSRHGLLPQVHKPGMPALKPPYDDSQLPSTVGKALHDFKSKLKTAKADGIDWRQLIDSLRPVTQKCWQYWPVNERKRFTRHIRHLWDVHRHRIAPDVGKMIQAMQACGQLQIHAGRILSYEQEKDGVNVAIKQYKTGKQYDLYVGAVINCTGPQCNYDKISLPAVESLRKQGLIRADALRLGIDTDENFALLTSQGMPSTVFFTLGPPLRSLYWESIAVPELRVQAKQLAERLVNSLVGAPDKIPLR